MHIRRFFAILSLVVLGGILVACGSDDDADPTATVDSGAVAPVPTESAAQQQATTEPAVTEEVAASPVASPVAATPVGVDATPVSNQVIEPMDADEEVGTPIAAPAIVPVTTDDEAEVEPTAVPLMDIAGTLTLDGRSQQDFTISDEGCVGLGEWRQLKPGTQVIVRDASGTVVDVGTLEAVDGTDGCSWSFAVQAPGADFFSVSIPMITEVWFDQDDPAVQSGEVEMFVP